MHERTVPLCDAVNQKDTGAMDFVGNLSGRFQLETLCTYLNSHVPRSIVSGCGL
ncbi:hypothetical protein DPMN_039209 [Dreissena polymorpha]|uniref:Uncharacterized protein n=1 Tax=Dreissena polymorpha TaxID=45954 RepID=A0A9D4MEL0_DREPO|nr:hypothetical protein DPMN_039209 [Dreissena polymorpha]